MKAGIEGDRMGVLATLHRLCFQSCLRLVSWGLRLKVRDIGQGHVCFSCLHGDWVGRLPL